MKKLTFYIKRVLLLVIFLGFSVVTFAQSDTIKVSDLFAMTLEELMQISVSSDSKKAAQISDIPASVEVIDRAEIETYGYSSLEEIIANITGYYAMNDLSYNYTLPGVRGFMSLNGTGVIILINGISQVRKGFESYTLRESSVPVECIDRIEIVKGPMSVMYGTGAFFGVINIITDKETDGLVAQATVSVGSLETIRTNVSVSGNEEKFNYSMNAGYSTTNGQNFKLSEVTDDLSKWQVGNAPLDTDGRLEGWDKYFDVSLNANSFYCKFSYLEMMQETWGIIAPWDDGVPIENSKMNVMMGYDKSFTDKLNVNASFRYNTLNNFMKISWLREDYYARESIRANSYDAEVRVNYTPFKKLDLTMGVTQNAMLDYNQIWDYTAFGGFYNNNNMELDKNNNITSTAGFFQAEYSPIDKLKIIAGFRVEKMSDYNFTQSFGSDTTGNTSNAMRTSLHGTYKDEGAAFIPRLAILYNINKSNTIKFFYGEAIKHPGFDENIQNVKDISMYGNLINEKIRTYELNYLATVSSVLNIKASLFHNQLENLITRVWVSERDEQPISHAENAGKYITNGAELSLLFSPIKSLRIKVSGTYQKTEDQREGFDDIDIPFSPDFLGYASLSYKLGKFSLALSGNYVDAMEAFWDGQSPDSDDPGARVGKGSDAYFTLSSNLRVSNLFNKGISANLKVSNLLNEKYRIPTSTLNAWADNGKPGYERMFLFSLNYQF